MATGPRGTQKSSEPRHAPEAGSRPFTQNVFCSGVDQIQLTLRPRTLWSSRRGGGLTPRPRDTRPRARGARRLQSPLSCYTQCTSRVKKGNAARGSGAMVPTLRRSDGGQERTEKFRQRVTDGDSKRPAAEWESGHVRKGEKQSSEGGAMYVIRIEAQEGATPAT